MHSYEVEYSDQKWIKIEEDNFNVVYKIPYSSIKDNVNCPKIENRFIVYILHGITTESKDYIYVGKSTKGLESRPSSHDSKYDDWTYCYVITRKDSKFLNDGVIQYMEDTIRRRIDECSDYYINTTNKTSSNTANDRDMDRSNKILEDVYDRLYVLGLDLTLPKRKTIEDYAGPTVIMPVDVPTNGKNNKGKDQTDNTYYINSPKNHVKAVGVVSDDGSITVQKGSAISARPTKAFTTHNYYPLREKLIKDKIIVNCVFVSDYTFNSLSAAAAVILGRSAAGPLLWLDSDKRTYRETHRL